MYKEKIEIKLRVLEDEAVPSVWFVVDSCLLNFFIFRNYIQIK